MFAAERVPRAEARRRLNLPVEGPVLLAFGIVREYKGLQDVLAALPMVREQLGHVTLVVAGEFWDDKQPYLELVERLGMADSVVIEDRYIPNEAVALYFSAADVLVAPYRRVTGSGTIQMARGLGVPVITTTVCEGLIEGAARVVPPGDPPALAAAIAGFFQADRGLHLADAAARGDARSSWDALVEQITAAGKAEVKRVRAG
jgi:glycosyltransferase involved in cell wall biosynthesis